MSYALLDSDELLRLSLDAINNDHHAEALSLLKTLLQRDDKHAFATYLLAAEHAQIGMMDAARDGFAKAIQLAPELSMARFQLGQLHLTQGDAKSARLTLAPLAEGREEDALSCYARGLIAAGEEQFDQASSWLSAGLARPQEVPALAADMQRLLVHLESALGGTGRAAGATETPVPPLYLSRYSQPDS